MQSQESHEEQVAIVAQEVGQVIRRDLRARTGAVKVAERDEGRRHVWRFRSGSEKTERFLHLAHSEMARENSTAKLLEQLKRAKWVDRIFEGTATSFMLSPRGQLRPWPKQ